MDSKQCIFCAIAAGQAHADMVYRDHDVMAFLPLDLNAYGHTLICPVAHREAIWDMDHDLLARVMAAIQTLIVQYRDTVGATGANILHASGRHAQQSVPHVHFHLIPRFPHDGLDAWPHLPQVTVDRTELARKLRGE